MALIDSTKNHQNSLRTVILNAIVQESKSLLEMACHNRGLFNEDGIGIKKPSILPWMNF